MTDEQRRRSSRGRCWSAATLFACLPVLVCAQLAFDVASIKENKTLDDGGSLRLMPGGGITAARIPARSLLTIAYGLQGYEVVGAPEWTRTTYYDVNARPAATATREQTLAMFRTLLVDRFKLTFHRESRQLDGFALVRVRTDALGPNLRRSEIDCDAAFNASPRCREGGITNTTMKANGALIWSLQQLLIAHMRAPISDDTGLTGTYDFELRWSSEVSAADDLRPIDVAIQDQLGLKLERRRVPVDVFVVERMERATPD